MRYALIHHHVEAGPEDVGEEQWNEAQAAFAAYLDALDDAGVLITAGILQPGATAMTLRAAGGKLTVHDGPFTETKEQFGGIFFIDVRDCTAAVHMNDGSGPGFGEYTRISDTGTRFPSGLRGLPRRPSST